LARASHNSSFNIHKGKRSEKSILEALTPKNASKKKQKEEAKCI